MVAATIASVLPFPFVGNLGDLALYALGEQGEAELAAGMALGMVPGGKLMGMVARSKIGSFIGRIGASAWGTAKHYASSFGRAVFRGAGNAALSLADRAVDFLRRKPSAACGCFAAGTLVWSASGQVPIEQLEVGDLVLAKDEASGALVLRPVAGTIVTHQAALLDLTLVDQSGCRRVLRTTDEHPFWVQGQGWTRADALEPGMALDTLAGPMWVESLTYTDERTTVYNLSVQENPSYFVGPDGVLVHNCEGKLVLPGPNAPKNTARLVLVNAETGAVYVGKESEKMHYQIFSRIGGDRQNMVGGLLRFGPDGKPVSWDPFSGSFDGAEDTRRWAQDWINSILDK